MAEEGQRTSQAQLLEAAVREHAKRSDGTLVISWADDVRARETAEARCAELEAERLTPEEAEAVMETFYADADSPDLDALGRARTKLRARASSLASVDPGGEA